MKTQLSNRLGFLRTTAIGGVLFLLPVAVIVVLLGYVFQAVVSVHKVLKEWIPFDSATGIALLFGLAIVLLFAACFVAGLIAHRAIGVHFSRTVESQLMKVYPKYGIYKDILAGKFGSDKNAPSLSPVLIKKEDCLFPAFQADRLANGLVVVYFPGSPDTWNGSLALVASERVQPLDVPFLEMIEICERLGRNSRSHLSAAGGVTNVGATEDRRV
jgi:uncharacterized membrane protein